MSLGWETPKETPRKDKFDPGEVVQLSIPVRADLVILARLTASTVATRAGFGVEEIEDLRLAVEELCLSLVDGKRAGRLHLDYLREPDAIRVNCSFEPEAGAPDPGGIDTAVDELSLRILDALVDDHGREPQDAGPSAWLVKRSGRLGAR